MIRAAWQCQRIRRRASPTHTGVVFFFFLSGLKEEKQLISGLHAISRPSSSVRSRVHAARILPVRRIIIFSDNRDLRREVARGRCAVGSTADSFQAFSQFFFSVSPQDGPTPRFLSSFSSFLATSSQEQPLAPVHKTLRKKNKR